MVMELIEGETLAARIEKGAIPLDRLTGAGWRIRRMSRGLLKYMCGRSPGREADGRFPWGEEPCQCGPATADYAAKGDSFAVAKPRVWTEARLRKTGVLSNYDLAPDGKRLAAFVADDSSGAKPITHLTFLLNFFDELRRKAPLGH